jgi:integrase/recombinase XerD
MTTALAPSPLSAALPGSPLPAVFAGGPKAERRFWEFFATQLSNDNTRRAYFNAVRRFAEWCELRDIDGLAQVEPIHIAAYLKALQEKLSTPTVKQHLAALRMLFDWLVMSHVLDVNPAHAVRGPKYSVKKGKTPVLDASEARALLDSIAVTRTVTLEDGSEAEQPLLVGLRDRALIGVMAYTFARISAVLSMRVEDYYVQGRQGWVRLHEKGGKEITMPCHHNLDRYLEEYVAAAAIAGDARGRSFAPCAAARGRS